MCHKYHVKHISKQCNLDRLKSRSKRDTNGRQPVQCLCTPNERSLVRGGEGYNQGSFVYFAKACGGWVFAGVNGVSCVDV